MPPQISEWMPWVFASILIVLTASLLGQAAYIRSRLDAIAPPPLPSSECTACYPAVRAYSIKVNTSATKMLNIDLESSPVTVNVPRQLGTCGLSKDLVQLHNGKFTAKWLVLKGSGSASLLSDVVNGYTRYIVAKQNTYIVVAATGSPREQTAIATLSKHNILMNPGDVFFLVQTVATFDTSFVASETTPTNVCNPLIATSPILLAEAVTSDSLFNAISASPSDLTIHIWGYAGAASAENNY